MIQARLDPLPGRAVFDLRNQVTIKTLGRGQLLRFRLAAHQHPSDTPALLTVIIAEEKSAMHGRGYVSRSRGPACGGRPV
jgi:hypothetical protein